MSQSKRIFDLRALRGTLSVAVMLGGFLVAINFIMLAIVGPAPGKASSRQVPMAWDVREEVEERVAGLAKAEKVEPKPFLLYVGLSSAWEGIDPAALAANDGRDERVVPLCGVGGSGNAIEGLLDLTRPIARRHLCPTLAILCVHLMWLANRTDLPTTTPPSSLNPLPMLVQGDWSAALDRVAWWNWISKNSVYANQAAVSGLHSLKVAINLFPPADPWSAPKRIGLPPHAEAQFLRVQMAGVESAGVFDPRQYTIDGGQFVALNELITRFREMGSAVMIVLMPEMGPIRVRVPAVARQLLTESLQRSPSARGTPIFDFRDAIEDGSFSDYLHMNDSGRAQFTRLLARTIRDRNSAK